MTDINANVAGDVMIQHDLPERIRVMISREDGSPVFSHDKTVEVAYLTDLVPILVIRRDGGSLETIGGDIYSVSEMLKEIAENDTRCSRKKD